MKRLAVLFIALFAINAFAIDPIWNMRYTFGPESMSSPKLGAGIGLRTDFGSDVLIPINISGSLNKEWELGAKLDINTMDQFKNTLLSIDLGGKFHTKSGFFVELDGYFGLNRNNGSAIIATVGSERYIAKNFSNYYEARAGFLEGVTGEDGYVKFALGTIPTLHFGNVFKLLFEINFSGSVGNLTDDFMMDFIPKAQLQFGMVRIRLDFDIGLLQESNNRKNTIGLYALMAF